MPSFFEVFKLAKLYKKKYKLKIGVVNFDPMPKMFFNKFIKNFRITSINQKIDLLSKLKVDFIITKKFDKKFSKKSYETNGHSPGIKNMQK